MISTRRCQHSSSHGTVLTSGVYLPSEMRILMLKFWTGLVWIIWSVKLLRFEVETKLLIPARPEIHDVVFWKGKLNRYLALMNNKMILAQMFTIYRLKQLLLLSEKMAREENMIASSSGCCSSSGEHSSRWEEGIVQYRQMEEVSLTGFQRTA